MLIDDYEHVDATQQANGAAKVLPALIQDFAGILPDVATAAPPAVASDAKTYFGALGSLLSAYQAHHDFIFAVPAGQIAQFRSASVNAAFSSISAFSEQQCHYDLSAAAVPGASPPPANP